MKIFMSTPKEFFHKDEYFFSHMSYSDFLKNKRGISDFIKHGYSSSSLYSKLTTPTFIHKLYHERDPDYMAFLNEFLRKYKDYDVIVMNPGLDLVHPEFLHKNFPNSLKCLRFIDDPLLTYSYCLPFSWAFDCAIYCSPSYSNEFTMSEILSLSGLVKHKWFPHCSSNNLKPQYSLKQLKIQLNKRNNKAIYVGNYYTSKAKRLIKIKKELKNNLHIYGRSPLAGFIFPIMSTLMGYPNFKRIKELSTSKRELYYSNYSIGLNMHLSFPSRETGNARLYELAYRGLAQVVDTSEFSAISKIFEPETEILTYSTPNECVDQIKRLQNDKELRNKIAINSYKKSIKDYSYEKVINDTCEWFKTLTTNI